MRTPDLSVARGPVEQISTEELLPRGEEEQDQFIPQKYEDGKPFPIADNEYWKPFFLSDLTVLSFAATFIAIIIGLAVVYTQSRAHDGLASTNGDLHYLWTFGPTALFTVILVFWGLLEYQAKLLAPWHAMTRDYSFARNTIFLDFVSAWNVLILPKTITNKQPVAFLAITGSLFIRVLIVLSTGLLVSETVSITRSDVPLATTRKWTDGQDFNPMLEDNRAIRIVTAAQRWNLSYPLGTYGGYALPTIDLSKTPLPADAVATFNTDVFIADLQCEVGSNDFTYSATDVNKDGYPAKVTTKEVPETGASITCAGPDDGYSVSVGCPFVNVSFPGCDIPVTFDMYFNFTASQGIVQSPMAWFEDSYPHRCKKDDPAEYVGILTYDWVRPARTRFEIEFTALLCKPRYSMRHVPVSLRGNQLTPDSLARLANHSNDLDGDTRMLGNLSTMDLYTAAGPATQLPGEIEQMNATFTKDFLIERFNATAAQLARLYFTGPSNEHVTGQVMHDEERLVVRQFPFIFMEVILVLLSCICLALWFLFPKRLCPREPGSIGGLATILARSPLTMKFFRGTSTTPLQKVGLANIGTSYKTTTGVDEGGAYFAIIPSGQVEMNKLSPEADASKHPTWWRPFIVRTPWKIGIIIFTISLIVALEVLNGYSSFHDGILTLQMGEYVKYSWVYIPTLTMVAVNVLYNMVDFAAVVFYPYTVLHNGGRFTSKVMLEDLAGVIAPIALVSCLSKRNITVPATKLAIIAGSMLSIAVSGLYTARSVVSNQPVSLVVQEDLVLGSNLNLTGSYQEDTIKNLPAILVIDNAPYPKWTYEEFAFPQVALANDTSTFQVNTTAIHARIPAMRGEMNCTMLESGLDIKFSENVTGEAIGGSFIDPGYAITPKHPPPGCAAKVKVITPDYYAYYGEVSPYRPDNPECPAYAVSVGYVDPSGKNPDISMALCSPYLEKVDVDVTFTNSNFSIDTKNPPRAVPGSAVVHSRHQFIRPDSYYEYLDGGTWSNSSDNKNHGHNENMDFFFNTLIQSGRVSSAKELMGPDNSERFLKETSNLYSTTVAQILNAEFHPEEKYSDPSPDDRNETRSGTAARSEYRLVQSAISTHILTALLSFMLVCAIVAYSTMRTRDILPNDPCSIAAKASLLAYSKMLSEDVIPPGSEWLSDKQLKMNGTFGEGSRFRLKWWDEGQRYGIDVESDDDA